MWSRGRDLFTLRVNLKQRFIIIISLDTNLGAGEPGNSVVGPVPALSRTPEARLVGNHTAHQTVLGELLPLREKINADNPVISHS